LQYIIYGINDFIKNFIVKVMTDFKFTFKLHILINIHFHYIFSFCLNFKILNYFDQFIFFNIKFFFILLFKFFKYLCFVNSNLKNILFRFILIFIIKSLIFTLINFIFISNELFAFI